MAEKAKRKRRRVVSDEAIQKHVSSEEKSCGKTCEEELFTFTNKRTSLDDLKEETLKQVQEELYEDCRHEDEEIETDRRKWKRRLDCRTWNVLDKQLNARYIIIKHMYDMCCVVMSPMAPQIIK